LGKLAGYGTNEFTASSVNPPAHPVHGRFLGRVVPVVPNFPSRYFDTGRGEHDITAVPVARSSEMKRIVALVLLSLGLFWAGHIVRTRTSIYGDRRDLIHVMAIYVAAMSIAVVLSLDLFRWLRKLSSMLGLQRPRVETARMKPLG